MPSNEQAQRAGETRSGGARILVVEDNALNRLLLHDILELRGHVIIEAANVGDALPCWMTRTSICCCSTCTSRRRR